MPIRAGPNNDVVDCDDDAAYGDGDVIARPTNHDCAIRAPCLTEVIPRPGTGSCVFCTRTPVEANPRDKRLAMRVGAWGRRSQRCSQYQVANPLCVDMVLKRRIQSRQLIEQSCITRSRQECVAHVGAAKPRTVRRHEPQACSYVTRGARRKLQFMPSFIACVMQAGIGPCCYCRCAVAAVGHSQLHSALCVPLSLPVVAGSVVSCASLGLARLPAPRLDTKQCSWVASVWGPTADGALWQSDRVGLTTYVYA